MLAGTNAGHVGLRLHSARELAVPRQAPEGDHAAEVVLLNQSLARVVELLGDALTPPVGVNRDVGSIERVPLRGVRGEGAAAGQLVEAVLVEGSGHVDDDARRVAHDLAIDLGQELSLTKRRVGELELANAVLLVVRVLGPRRLLASDDRLEVRLLPSPDANLGFHFAQV